MDTYQEFLREQLAERIRLAGTEVNPSSVTDVLMKVKALYKELPVLEFGQPTGEVFRYLSKTDKVMVLRMVSLTASLLSTAKWDNDKGIIYADANLYFDRNDNRPVASYGKAFAVDRLMGGIPAETATLEQRAQAELMARGICETRCLSRFGIGEWDDADDPESALRKADEKSGFAPVVVAPATTPTSAPTPAPVAEVAAEAKVKAGQPETAPAPEKKPEKVKKEAAAPSLTLEQARAIKADIGIAREKGFTLGVVEEKNVINLRYLYKHSESAEVKEGVLVIARANPDIAKIFTDDGIVL